MQAYNFLNALIKILKEHGYILPETKEEMDAFDASKNSKAIPPIPKEVDDPIATLQRGYSKPKPLSSELDEETSAAFLAMAARSGKEIPDHVRKKMNEDRRNSSNEK